MLLSSAAFVAKPKTGMNKDNILKKSIKKQETYAVRDECEQCMKECAEENSVFKFPVACSSTSSCRRSVFLGKDGLSFIDYPGDRVTIATGDALCLSVEQFYYTIVLMEESEADITCIFRKKVIETKKVANGHVETVVFALDCDQDFYLTTSKHKALELNYHVSYPNADEPDERFFQVFCTDLGRVFIEPKLHQHTYLHHLDQFLSVQQLDLNWRCPEEYFFHFNAVPEISRRKSSDKKKICTHVKECSYASGTVMLEDSVESVFCDKIMNDCSNGIATDVPKIDITSGFCQFSYGKRRNAVVNLEQITDRLAISLPVRKQIRRKGVLANLLLGCFSRNGNSIGVSDS